MERNGNLSRALPILALLLAVGCGRQTAAAGDLVLDIAGQERILPREHVIELRLGSDGGITGDGEPLEPAAVTQTVAERHGADPDLLAVVDLSPAADCGRLEELLFAVREGGVGNLVFARDLRYDATGIPLTLPPQDLKLPQLKAANRLPVGISAAGDVAVDGAAPPAGGLVAELRRRLEANDHLVIFVEPDAAAPCGAFFDAMLALREAGAQRISLWGRLRVGG